MAVGDHVVLHQESTDPSMPLMGIVQSEAGADATVQWAAGNQTTLPQALLDKLFQPDGPTLALVGNGLRLTAYPYLSEPSVGDPPKTDAAWGICLDCYAYGTYDGGSADAQVIIVAAEDGQAVQRLELVGSPENEPYGVQTDRRVV